LICPLGLSLHNKELCQRSPNKVHRHKHQDCVHHDLHNYAGIVNIAGWLVLIYLEHLYEVIQARYEKSEEKPVAEGSKEDRKAGVDVYYELSEIRQLSLMFQLEVIIRSTEVFLVKLQVIQSANDTTNE